MRLTFSQRFKLFKAALTGRTTTTTPPGSFSTSPRSRRRRRARTTAQEATDATFGPHEGEGTALNASEARPGEGASPDTAGVSSEDGKQGDAGASTATATSPTPRPRRVSRSQTVDRLLTTLHLWRKGRGHAPVAGAATDAYLSPGSGVGVQGRDRAAHHQVEAPPELTHPDLTHLWEGSRIVQRAVAKRAAVAISRGVRLSMQQGQTRWLDQELRRLDALKHGLEGRTWGNLYGTGLVLVIPDGSSDPTTPLSLQDVRKVLRLRVVDDGDIDQIQYVRTTKDGERQSTSVLSRDAEPEYYVLSHTAAGEGPRRYHHTRVYRFDGTQRTARSLRQHRGRHASVLVAMDQALSRYDISIKALATQVEDANVGVWTIQDWYDMITSDEDEVGEWLDNQVLFRSILGDYACGPGDSFEFKGRPLKDSVEVVGQIMFDLAASVDMPVSELFGMAPPGLSTDDKGGRAKWHTDIETFERPVFADFLEWLLPIIQAQNHAPAEAQGAVTIEWPSLEALTAMQEQEARESRAKEADVYHRLGWVTREEGRRRLRQDPTWPLDAGDDVGEESLPLLEIVRQGRLVAQAGLLHREEEEANAFRKVLGMDPWTPQARERLLEAMRLGVGTGGAPGGGSPGGGQDAAVDAARESAVDALLAQGRRLLDQVGQPYACDAQTGDASRVWLGFPLPDLLASCRPGLAPYDDSPAHVTWLAVGDVRGREDELLALVRRAVQTDDVLPVRMNLAPHVDSLINRRGQRVHYQVITGDGGVWALHDARRKLVDLLRVEGFPITDVSPDDWMPHLTLAYQDDPDAPFCWGRLEGSWTVRDLHVWGLSNETVIPLGPPTPTP